MLTMGDKLKDRVIGLEKAIEVVTEAIRRSCAGLNDPSNPIVSLIFLGPTGVEKTELCKAQKYTEKHMVSHLLGAPPAYVRYDKGGQLTDAVHRKPYSIILLDEIEKVHPDVFNVILQLLNDGRVMASKGNIVSFCNCVIIFTSNIGS
eukprot:3405294-Ditylum_brightwellii.AAC.1